MKKPVLAYAMALMALLCTKALKSQAYQVTTGNDTPTLIDQGQGWSMANMGMYDDDINHIPIGFNFNVDGQNHDSVYVSSNGFLWFGSAIPGADVIYKPLADAQGTGNFFVAAFASDLHNSVDVSRNADWQYELRGTSPNRSLVVEWEAANFYLNLASPATENFTFQVILEEGSNDIQVRYGNNSKMNQAIDTVQIGIRDFAGNVEVLTNPANDFQSPVWTNNPDDYAVVVLANYPTSATSYTFTPANVHLQEVLADKLSFYPNPVVDYVVIHENEKVEIFNESGHCVKRIDCTEAAGDRKVDVGDLPPGLYILRTNKGSYGRMMKL